jgi:hypothetical protein
VVALYSGEGPACSAVVLSRDVVLTAAHCAANPSELRIRSARHSFESRVQAIAKSPVADLALLKLDGMVPPTAVGSLSAERPAPGSTVTIIGYGDSVAGMPDTRGVLREVKLLTVSSVEAYPAPVSVLWASGSGKNGACQGDSGGAMTQAGVIVAIISAIVSQCGGETGGVLLGPERAWIDATLATWDRAASWIAAPRPGNSE